ncbi:hypothetical protein [Tabrizicola aquatica]|uniref:hypothetical protein n=1 Tax=Tabrizicola aquatica TaxID=909926 RepID=UPI0011AF24DD|nr:hypothetical protein [Tabrizicola aquatica]
MFRMKTLAATALAGVLATAAFAEVDQIKTIDVTADLTSIQNEQAASFWANLEADLENAIASRVTDRTSNDGAEIIIDIREVELANAFERELNLGDAVLVGQVNIKDDTDNSNYDAYELTVSLETAQIVVPEGTVVVLSNDTTGAYNRLVEAFAEGVVTRLK